MISASASTESNVMTPSSKHDVPAAPHDIGPVARLQMCLQQRSHSSHLGVTIQTSLQRNGRGRRFPAIPMPARPRSARRRSHRVSTEPSHTALLADPSVRVDDRDDGQAELQGEREVALVMGRARP